MEFPWINLTFFENFFKNLVFPYSTRTFDRFDTIKLIPFFDKIKPVLNKAISKTGKPTYSLEALAHANNVGSAAAHDATEDVIMTASLVKILKKEDNNLFSDIFKLKDKNYVKQIKNEISKQFKNIGININSIKVL